MKILFDCDGTLIDSMGIWLKSMQDLIKKSGYSIETMTEEEREQIDTLSYDDCVKYIWENFVSGMSEEEVTAYFDGILEDGYRESIPAKDGVIETIQTLHKKGYQMAVASSNSFYLVEMALKRLGIFDYFVEFLTPDRTGFKKNQVEFWQNAADKLETTPDNLILFDDALYAIKSAKKAGLRTVGIKDFPLNESEWEDIEKEADFALNGVDEISLKNVLK